MRKLTLILIPLLLSACGQEPAAPVANQAPTFDFMNNPDNGNPRIYRIGDDGFAVAWTDPRTNLRATHWTDRFVVTPGCGDFEGGPISRQEVGLIDADDLFASQLRVNEKGPVWIIVRDLNQPGDCFGASLVAEGWGQAHYTDNDAFFIGPERPNANAWGYMGEGALTAPDGSTLQYAGSLRFAVTNDGTFRVERPQITIR
jgi:hypothetical protein